MVRETTPISPIARGIYSGSFKPPESDMQIPNLDGLHAERLGISGAITHFIQIQMVQSGGLIGITGNPAIRRISELKEVAFDSVMKVASDCVSLIEHTHLQKAVERLSAINNAHPLIFGNVFNEYASPVEEIAADSQNVFDDAEVVWKMIPGMYRELKGGEIDFPKRLEIARNSSEVLIQRSNMHGIDFEIKKEQIMVAETNGERRFKDGFVEMVEVDGKLRIRIKSEQLAVADEDIEVYMQDATSERVIERNKFTKKGCPARIKFNDGTQDYISYLYSEFISLIEANGDRNV